MKRKLLCATLLLSAFLLFAQPAHAATVAELEALIAHLQRILAQLIAQRAQLDGGVSQQRTTNTYTYTAPTQQYSMLNVNSAQSKAADTNELSAGETGYIVGSGFTADTDVVIGGETVGGRLQGTVGQNLIFSVPHLSAGTYTLYVENENSTSNSIRVTVRQVMSQEQAPTVSSAQAKAADHNELYAGEPGYVFGSGFTSDTKVIIDGVEAIAALQGTAGQNLIFLVPELDSGEYELSVRNDSGTSNEIDVTVR